MGRFRTYRRLISPLGFRIQQGETGSTAVLGPNIGRKGEGGGREGKGYGLKIIYMR